MLAAAFPRAAWGHESEAIYAMSLAAAGIHPAVARAAVAGLVREEEHLPTIATVLNRCYAIAAGEVLDDLSCPGCGSHIVAADRGACLCFDCDHEWRLP
jgi:hypothetical protein